MVNHTTQSFSRTARPSGTELAGCYEHHRRTDRSGIKIISGVIALVLLGWLIGGWL